MPGDAPTIRYGEAGGGSAPEPSRKASLAPGAMVGEYRVERLIGRGTFGDVYAAEQPLIGKRVAVKVLREDLAAEPELVARFVSEARAVNLIKNRHIVDIFSFGKVGEQGCYFVMELLEGRTLAELIEREGRIGLPRALPILRGIADALDAAHRAGVTHRDLKPENVFLVPESDGSHTPKLLDFGVAKLCRDDVTIKTVSGIALGTPRYMSPEQCRGKHVDHRSDIYALGAVIHEMLTGKPPFDAETATELMIKQTVDPPPSMSSVCPEVPPELDAPVLSMLAKRAADRPSSAGEAVAALAARAHARAPMAETLPLGSVRNPPLPSGGTVALEPASTVRAIPAAALPQPPPPAPAQPAMTFVSDGPPAQRAALPFIPASSPSLGGPPGDRGRRVPSCALGGLGVDPHPDDAEHHALLDCGRRHAGADWRRGVPRAARPRARATAGPGDDHLGGHPSCAGRHAHAERGSRRTEPRGEERAGSEPPRPPRARRPTRAQPRPGRRGGRLR